MKALLILLPLTFLTISLFAQTTDKSKVFSYVEQMPEFKGDLNAYLSKNIHYPEDARKNDIEGRVFLKFLVDTAGRISDIMVIRSVFPSIDSEAIRVIRNMPAWRPAKQSGKAVMVYYNLPIVFKLEDSTPKK
jgi:protein TonB